MIDTNEITLRLSSGGVYTHAALFIDIVQCQLVVHRFNEDSKRTGFFEFFDLLEHPELVEVYDVRRGAWDLEAITCLLDQPQDVAAAAD